MTSPTQKHIALSLSTLMLCSMLAACDRSPDPGNSASAEQPAAPPLPRVVQASSAADVIPPSVEEAQAFVLSRLARQSLPNGTNWLPFVVSLSPQQWVWRELQTTVIGLDSYVIESEEYNADPRALSVPVRSNGNSIRFECALIKCINVQKSVETITTSSTEAKKTVSTEQRVGNTWLFSSAEEATRVAAAMNLVLTSYGARAKVF